MLEERVIHGCMDALNNFTLNNFTELTFARFNLTKIEIIIMRNSLTNR